MLSKNFRFWFLVALLLFGAIGINWFETKGENVPDRFPLKELSRELGEWKQAGGDIRFSEQTESILKADEYIARDYFYNGRRANVYIGYYKSQRTGATYHSPLNCLPGAGWVMKEPALTEIKTSDGKTFIANRYIIQNDQYKEFLIYWYQGRGRAVASEYKDKIYTIWDSINLGRSDGAMVRVITPVGESEEESLRQAIDLSARLSEKISAFVPN